MKNAAQSAPLCKGNECSNTDPNHIEPSLEQLLSLKQLLILWPDPAFAVDKHGILIAVSPKANQLLCGLDTQLGEPIHRLLCIQAREFQHEQKQCPFYYNQDETVRINQAQRDWSSSYWCTLDGEYLSVDVRASQLAAPFSHLTIWSFVDNSARQHNQAELQKFAQFVDLSPAPIAQFDEYGQLLFANRALQELMVEAGFNDQGQSCVIPSGIEAICHTCLDGSGTLVAIKLNEQYFEWHFHPMNSRDDSVHEYQSIKGCSVLGFAFDVTEQKDAELALLKAQSAARRDFYAKMIHELRTPLNAIMGFSDLLLRRTENRLDAREMKNLQAIKNAGFQLNELVSDTLDISKIEAGYMVLELAEFDFNALCESFIPQIEALAGAKGLILKCALEPDVFIQSDRQKLRQIVINLLSNAIKYTPLGWVSLSAVTRADRLIISVSDSGLGIPKEQIKKLFKNYQQIDDEQNIGIPGTGLGLALVQELTVLLGGTVSVVSEHQKGSTFTVTLPLCRDKSAVSEAS